MTINNELMIHVELDGEVLGTRDTLAVHLSKETLAKLYERGREAFESGVTVKTRVLRVTWDFAYRQGDIMYIEGEAIGFILAVVGCRIVVCPLPQLSAGTLATLQHYFPTDFVDNYEVNLPRYIYDDYLKWRNRHFPAAYTSFQSNHVFKAGDPVFYEGKKVGEVEASMPDFMVKIKVDGPQAEAIKAAMTKPMGTIGVSSREVVEDYPAIIIKDLRERLAVLSNYVAAGYYFGKSDFDEHGCLTDAAIEQLCERNPQ